MDRQYDVFISYRRDGGEYLAHNLYERLKDRGFSVFQDVESLRSGNFNTALYDVIVLLPPHGLDRCVNEDDWVRKELAYAIETGKNIIPVFMPGFQWPEYLPPDICDIRNINGLTSTTAYFDQFIEKLIEFLASSNKNGPTQKKRHGFRMALLFLVYGVGLAYPLFHTMIPELPFTLVPRIFYFMWIIAGALWLWDRIETRPDFAAECFGTIREDELDLQPTELYSRIAGVFGTKALISTDVPKGFVSYYRLKRLEFGSWDGKKTNYLRVVFRRALEYYDPSVLYLHALSRGGQAIKMLTRQGFVLQTTPDIMNCPNTIYTVKNQLHVFLCYNGKKLDRAVIYNCHADALRDHLRGSGKNEL